MHGDDGWEGSIVLGEEGVELHGWLVGDGHHRDATVALERHHLRHGRLARCAPGGPEKQEVRPATRECDRQGAAIGRELAERQRITADFGRTRQRWPRDGVALWREGEAEPLLATQDLQGDR